MNIGFATLPLGVVEKEVRAMLARSVATDPCEDVEDVMDEVTTNNAQLWLVSDGITLRGVVVTQVVGGRAGKQCFIRHCAGNGIADWLYLLSVIEAWAKSEGCATIELIGREGFERMLGWKRQAVMLRKEL